MPGKIRPAVSVALFVALAIVLSGCRLVIPIPNDDGWVRPYYCDPTDTAINDGHGMHFEMAYTTEKGPLSDADCKALQQNINAAEAFAAQYPTVADAVAGGFVEAAVWSPGQGIHYVDPARFTASFDPNRPNWLLYDGNTANARLTGMMWGVNSGTMPPAGFPGGNDHWHIHHELCVQNNTWPPYILGEHLTAAECTALGGTLQATDSYWMVHIWRPLYGGWLADDIFNKTHDLVP